MWKFPLFPEQASSYAWRVDTVFFGMLGVAVFFSVLISVLLITFAIRYREGSDADRTGGAGENLAVEIAWIAIPLLIALGLFVWTAQVFFGGARGLEWESAHSPPLPHNFEFIPKVEEEAYAYDRPPPRHRRLRNRRGTIRRDRRRPILGGGSRCLSPRLIIAARPTTSRTSTSRPRQPAWGRGRSW